MFIFFAGPSLFQSYNSSIKTLFAVDDVPFEIEFQSYNSSIKTGKSTAPDLIDPKYFNPTIVRLKLRVRVTVEIILNISILQ